MSEVRGYIIFMATSLYFKATSHYLVSLPGLASTQQYGSWLPRVTSCLLGRGAFLPRRKRVAVPFMYIAVCCCARQYVALLFVCLLGRRALLPRGQTCSQLVAARLCFRMQCKTIEKKNAGKKPKNSVALNCVHDVRRAANLVTARLDCASAGEVVFKELKKQEQKTVK